MLVLYFVPGRLPPPRDPILNGRAEDISGIAQLNLGNIDQAITSFTAIRERLSAFGDADHRYWQARALFNKGVTLGALGRSEDEIAVYDDLLTGFGTATELPLREQVASAFFNKGVTLGALGRSGDAIAVYDDLLARFATATELPLREQVAKARHLKAGLQKSSRLCEKWG